MLQTAAVNKSTLELLKDLMKSAELTDFYLVGGTALTLQMGHRLSDDIDLFTNGNFDEEKLKNRLSGIYNVQVTAQSKNTLSAAINEIKVDFIRYDYPLIDAMIEEEGVRMLSVKDIAPMKLSAIAQRGAKKDFFDLYFILQQYSLKELMGFFNQKFVNTDHFHILKSLTYFNDADGEPDPVMIQKASWQDVKKYIQNKVKNHLSN